MVCISRPWTSDRVTSSMMRSWAGSLSASNMILPPVRLCAMSTARCRSTSMHKIPVSYSFHVSLFCCGSSTFLSVVLFCHIPVVNHLWILATINFHSWSFEFLIAAIAKCSIHVPVLVTLIVFCCSLFSTKFCFFVTWLHSYNRCKLILSRSFFSCFFDKISSFVIFCCTSVIVSYVN